MDSRHERLLTLVAEARKSIGLDKQADLIKASGLSRSTVRRFERGESIDESSLRKLSRAVRWTPDSAQDVLDGGEPTPAAEKPQSDPAGANEAEPRYRSRETVSDAGRLIGVVEDAIYQLYVTGAPDAPFEEYDKTRRRVLDALRDAGIGVAERHDETSSGTDPDA